jgi:hypothetical protein
MPGRTTRKQPAPDKNGPLPNFRGVLKMMDDKSLSVALGDDRVLDFKRTSSTKFFKNGDEVKTPQFNVGDQVSVEAQEQPGGSMNAVNVYWEKAASGWYCRQAGRRFHCGYLEGRAAHEQQPGVGRKLADGHTGSGRSGPAEAETRWRGRPVA